MSVQVRPVPAPLPPDEEERLADLRAYEILDSDPEEPFDDLVALAAAICGTPMARVNFIDAHRQWAKAVLNMDREAVPREEAFCAHTIAEPDGFMLVADAATDRRFARNPFVLDDPHIRFYAGAAILHGETGRPLGALCVLDTKPHDLRDEQVDALRRLAKLVTNQLELRRLLTGERHLVHELRELDRQKAEFTAVVAHDFRTPLTAVRGFAELLAEGEVEPARATDAIMRSSDRLLRLVDDLTGTATDLAREPIDLGELLRAAVDQLRPAAAAANVELRADPWPAPVSGDPYRLAQVLDNLVGNAVKYAPGGHVSTGTAVDGDDVLLTVADTGVGVPPEELPRLFDRFYRASTSRGFAGTGIGLSVAKTIVEGHGGTIEVASRPGRGTTFTVRLPRRT